MPQEKTTKEKLIDEFDKLTPCPEDCGDNYDEQKEWLEKNKHLYNNEVYNEPMYDLSEDKIKNFLSQAIDQTREETIKEVEEMLNKIVLKDLSGKWSEEVIDFSTSIVDATVLKIKQSLKSLINK